MQHTSFSVVILAVEVDLPISKQRADDGERLLESADPPVVGEPEGVVFPAVPACAETHNESTLRDGVDRRSLLGEHRWRMETGAGDERADLDPVGDGGNCCKGRPGLPRTPRPCGQVVEQVIADPERVEPCRLRDAAHRQVFGKRDLPLDFWKLNANLHDPHSCSDDDRSSKMGDAGAATCCFARMSGS